MQLTIQQLKSEVLKHVSAEWVRETYGKLTLKQTWQDAYDRTREYAAAKLEQAKEVIESEQGQVAIATVKTVAVKGFRFSVDAAVWLVKAAIVMALVVLELCQEGAIERLTGKSQEVVATVRKYSTDYLSRLNKLQLVKLVEEEGLAIDSRAKAADMRVALEEVTV